MSLIQQFMKLREDRKPVVNEALLIREYNYYSGASYEGQYEANSKGKSIVPHGWGAFRWPNTDLSYIGQWYKGEQSGYGLLVYKGSQEKAEGMFHQGKLHGVALIFPKAPAVSAATKAARSRKKDADDDKVRAKDVVIYRRGAQLCRLSGMYSAALGLLHYATHCGIPLLCRGAFEQTYGLGHW